ncbi:MAG TPA: DUF6776 family protein [Pyrinomonadaceae bacterium]|nr:DUF6776 family protein [Pyrinomonadaceae bacterium]
MLQSLRRAIRLHKTTGSFVVKRQLSPRTKLLVIGGVAAVILGGVLFIYEHGLTMAGFERALATRTQQTLEDDNHRIRDENQQLREALARAERAIQMDQAAYQDLDKTLQVSAQEIVKLREELNFYRNIISPTDKKAGLRVQSLDIQHTGSSNYRYKLVLIQALKHERSVLGTANLEISGTQSGQNVTIRIPAANERAIQVNLKYFQDIEGKFELPKGFRPRLVKVNVVTGGGAQTAEAVYDWPNA